MVKTVNLMFVYFTTKKILGKKMKVTVSDTNLRYLVENKVFSYHVVT